VLGLLYRSVMPLWKKVPPDRSARPRSVLTGHDGSAEAVAIAPDGTWLATTSGDQTARIWAVDGPRAAGNGDRASDVARPVGAADPAGAAVSDGAGAAVSERAEPAPGGGKAAIPEAAEVAASGGEQAAASGAGEAEHRAAEKAGSPGEG
jgi:hypothetical protein